MLIGLVLVCGSQAWAGVLADSLVQAVAQNDAGQASEIVNALKSTGDAVEIALAVDMVAALLNDPNFVGRSGLIEAWLFAMNELDRARAVDALGSWLLDVDPRLQLVAATCLGRLGDESAVSPLASELMLVGNHDAVLQAAANSLAIIGGAVANDALFLAHSTGGAVVKQAVATAIASLGDENAQAALDTLTGGVEVSSDTAAMTERLENPTP